MKIPPLPDDFPVIKEPVILESQEKVLVPNIPEEMFYMTIKLKGFNHKFQDDTPDIYEWITLEIVGNNHERESEYLDLSISRSMGEDGKPQIIYSATTLGNYIFEVTDLNYEVSVNIVVHKVEA